MLCTIGFLALALAGLTQGGVLAWISVGLIAALAMAMGIVVCVANPIRRALAIGFLIPFLAYGLIHYVSARDEASLYQGKLPTTRMLKSAFELVETRQYFDRQTGEVIAGYDPNAPNGTSGKRRSISWETIPEPRSFVMLGHALMAMALGIVGGLFALRVRDTRTG